MLEAALVGVSYLELEVDYVNIDLADGSSK